MKRTTLFCFVFLSALLCKCSLSPQAGGTTDTGNARVAATIYTAEGVPAASLMVTACPDDYLPGIANGTDITTPSEILHTTTNDTGYFRFDSITNGEWVIEVNDETAQAVRLEVTLDDSISSLHFEKNLAPYAMINGNVGAVTDSTMERYCLIRGMDRKIPVAPDGTFKADDLPSGVYDITIVSENDNWSSRVFESVEAISDSTVSIGDTVSEEDTVSVTVLNPAYDTTIFILNTGVSGADISDTLIRFPVVVRLGSEDIDFEKAGHDGEFIRFCNARCSLLPHAVERWDRTKQQGTVWVLIDSLYGNDSTQSFMLVCGKQDSLQSTATVPNPFDTADGFLACYHLDGTLNDATANAFHGTDHGTMDTETGIIANSRMFNGNSSYFDIADLPVRSAGTISFWFKPGTSISGATATTQGIWGIKASNSVNCNISLQGTDFWAGTGSAGALITKLEDSDTGFYLSSSMRSFKQGAWYFATWCWGNGGDSLYVNGALQATAPDCVNVGIGGVEEIGRSYYDTSNIWNGGPLYFTGILDEFRIEKVTRSPAWIKLCYMNQRSDDHLVSIDSLITH